MPDIPTFKEAGYPDLTVEVVYYLLASRGTPRPIVDKLYGAIDKALQNPKIKDALSAQGVDEKRGPPDALAAYIAAELGRWADIVKLSGTASGTFVYQPERFDVLKTVVDKCNSAGSFRVAVFSNILERFAMSDSVPGPDAVAVPASPRSGFPSQTAS